MNSVDEPILRSEVAQSLSLDQVRYSAVWEDHRLLTEGLEIGNDDDILSITSAGTNVLALLLQEPRTITAIDMNPAQSYFVEIKFAGIRHLTYEKFVEFMGVIPSEGRVEIYRELREYLSPSAALFWDENLDGIGEGLYQMGRLDRYFAVFREEHMAEVWPPDLVERLFTAPDLETQAKIFEGEALTDEFKKIFCTYYGRDMMASRGRDPSQFRYVDEMDVGAYFLRRFHDVCTRMPMQGNFYLERFLTGEYRSLEEAPLYLRRDNFVKLRGLLDRVTLITEELETHLAAVEPGTYSKANLSDVFEYMSEDASDSLFGLFVRSMRGGGRLAYWNLLVERKPPQILADRLISLSEKAQDLWREDRAWFYSSFHLEEIRR